MLHRKNLKMSFYFRNNNGFFKDENDEKTRFIEVISNKKINIIFDFFIFKIVNN